MTPSVTTVAYGRPASEALADAIERAKGGSALAPVTVVVPSNFAGLTARRLLGEGIVGPGGIANVSFVTPFRLAELLTADRLLDTRPITKPVLGAAIRRALAADPGPFAPVAEHEATELALAALYAELSNVSPALLDRLAAQGGVAAASAVRIFRAIAAHLHGFHGEADVARSAAARPDLATELEPFGPVIWYLPAPTTAPMADFLGAVLAAAVEASVIVGSTGDLDADEAVWSTCGRAGVGRGADRATVPIPTVDRIVSVTDADEEVRVVVREVVRLAEDGVPLARIGVFYPTPEPYVGIIEQQLAAAGVPGNGPSARRLFDSAAGRSLLGALELPSQRWRRDQVMKLISGAPVRGADGPVRPSAWETLSRRAGIVAERSDWSTKLGRLRSTIEARREACDPVSDERRIEHLDRELADLDQLAHFVTDVAGAVDGVATADTWPAKSEATLSLLHLLLGLGHTHAKWPQQEQQAFERIEDALARLATLGELEPRPSDAVFVRALRAELDVPAARNGRFGEGLTYGPLRSAAGYDLDAVFVVGCIEGLCPSPRREDAMLPDHARAIAGGELEVRAGRLHDLHRAFLAALSSAPFGRRMLVVPRGDLRGGRRPLPSRWVLDSASVLSGGRVNVSGFDALDASVVDLVPSFATGLAQTLTSASVDERDLATLFRYAAEGGDVAAHPVADLVGRGLHAQAARRSSAFTEWDGNLAGQAMPSSAEAPLSASRLEAWAGCGFRYYLASVLGLRELDEPEQLPEATPLDKGSLVHRVIERFIAEAIAEGAPDPDEPWSPAHHHRLAAIATEELDALERLGRTGRPLLWRRTRAQLSGLFEIFLAEDDAHRSRRRARPLVAEMPFGFADEEPVVLALDDGRIIAFHGWVDRVDQCDGGRLVVSDYKTGKSDKFRGIADDDPVQGGATLQLGLYAEAASARFGGQPVDAEYWMVNEGAEEHYGYAWTDDRRTRLLEVVTGIADGIEAGAFPAVPGEWDSYFGTHGNCTYCDFDRVCPRGRGEQAVAKLDAPALRFRDALAWAPEPEEAP